jgi:hypothetical protein
MNDVDFTTISDMQPFTLDSGAVKNMDLRFTANTIGRTNGFLEFYFNGPGSPAKIQLFGQGIGGAVKVLDDSAYSGEKRFIKLKLMNDVKPNTSQSVSGFKAKISYDRTILTMTDSRAIRQYNKGEEIAEFIGNWDGQSVILGEYEVYAGLGLSDTADLCLEEFHWLNSNNNIINSEIDKYNGTFKLLGICNQGGKRLLNPNGTALITGVSPNPSADALKIDYQLIESGRTEFMLYNYLGEPVKSVIYDNVSDFGKRIETIQLGDLSSGQYLLVLKTPTITDRIIVMVVK